MLPSRLCQESRDTLFMTEQGLHFAAQGGIRGAGLVQKGLSLNRIKIERLITQFFDLFLSIGIRIHRLSLFGPAYTTVDWPRLPSSRRSHRRA